MSPAPNPNTPVDPGNPPQKSEALRNIIQEQKGRMRVLDQERNDLRRNQEVLRERISGNQGDIGRMQALAEGIKNTINAYSNDDINEAVTQFIQDVNQALLTLQEKIVSLEADNDTANASIAAMDEQLATRDEEYDAYQSILSAVGEPE